MRVKSGTGVTETYFLNDGDDPVVDYNSSKAVVALYVPGPSIDEPIVMSTPNGDGTCAHQYFHTNHQGIVIATSNDAAARQGGPYVYDPYGNCYKLSSSCASLGTVPFAFTGQRLIRRPAVITTAPAITAPTTSAAAASCRPIPSATSPTSTSTPMSETTR